jgi:hypothetical protein
MWGGVLVACVNTTTNPGGVCGDNVVCVVASIVRESLNGEVGADYWQVLVLVLGVCWQTPLKHAASAVHGVPAGFHARQQWPSTLQAGISGNGEQSASVWQVGIHRPGAALWASQTKPPGQSLLVRQPCVQTVAPRPSGSIQRLDVHSRDVVQDSPMGRVEGGSAAGGSVLIGVGVVSWASGMLVGGCPQAVNARSAQQRMRKSAQGLRGFMVFGLVWFVVVPVEPH